MDIKQIELEKNYLKNKNERSEIKHPNFNDSIIDNQLIHNITYEILIDDINSLNELLYFFENLLINLFVSERKAHILKIFQKHHLKFTNFILYCFLSRRKITLIYFMIKLHFEENNDLIKKTITEDYLSITKEKVHDQFLLNIKNLNLKKESVFLSDLLDIIQTNFEHEKMILQTNYIPSICSISIFIKFFKLILEKGILKYQKILTDFNENCIIDFLLLVFLKLFSYAN